MRALDGSSLGVPVARGFPSAPLGWLMLQIFAVTFVFSLIVQDIAFPQVFAGRLSASLSVFLLPVFLFFPNSILRAMKRTALIHFFRVGMSLNLFILLFSLSYLFFVPPVAFSEVLSLKTAKTAITIFVWWLSILAGVVLGQRAKTALFWVSRFGFAFLMLFLLIEVMNPSPNQIAGPFHYLFAFNYRPRLLSPEASIAGGVIVSFGLLIMLTSRARLEQVLIAVTVSAGLWFVGSKGGILVFIASLGLAYLWHAWRDLMARRLRSFMVMLAVLFALGTVVQPVTAPAINGLQQDLTQFTSLATRSTMLVSGLVVLTQQPLGGGFGTYLAFAPGWLEQSMLVTGRLFNEFNLREIKGYLLSNSDNAFVPKDLPTTLIWFGGWFGLAQYLFIVFTLLARVRRQPPIAKAAALFFVLASATYLTSIYEYNLMFLVGFLLNGSKPSREST
jgi:O-antigen ligase